MCVVTGCYTLHPGPPQLPSSLSWPWQCRCFSDLCTSENSPCLSEVLADIPVPQYSLPRQFSDRFYQKQIQGSVGPCSTFHGLSSHSMFQQKLITEDKTDLRR
ncbi:hypothetical protein E2562_038165 [Oryza meyeriana var. granulata]|uniref:Uncharacterized protein n=1 Tax=Oryza meyeriana var. granulata TaxID=110450 RepID=A0A6G1CLX8_9ORYZ|nr:hypothetical protein E2562_038165 [Oryza meyeriana var. granulata]KAF0901148.1 hypothetical protein E2562_038165 [Oryza meyeriana var. granulata]KAF0901149.1 hypothetical protein E2562_038165 [Oryza meyeriana var. granulata]KAF0901150.1 hypothetical protein E2562_038165 [Oryza meyeriana var. granulata]